MNTRDVPVISIKHLEDAETRKQIDYACREWGFFQVVDHGIAPELIDEIHRLMIDFFSLNTESKRQILRTGTNPWGFYDQELTKNTPDWKEIYDYGPAFTSAYDETGIPQWPAQLPRFRQATEHYYLACEALAFRLLSPIAENLGADPEALANSFTGCHTSFLRMNYYPVCPQPESPPGQTEPQRGHLGINRHTDAGAITLLLQDDQPGLQVFNRNHWHLVKPVPGAITVNIGDIVQVWSNDQYRAALHRVLASASERRFSLPFFFNPGYDTDYQPLASTIDADNPARYDSINWGHFRSRRAAGDYSDQGQEVQISDFYRNTNV